MTPTQKENKIMDKLRETFDCLGYFWRADPFSAVLLVLCLPLSVLAYFCDKKPSPQP